MRTIQLTMSLIFLLAFLGCSGSQSSPTTNSVPDCTVKEGYYSAYTCTSSKDNKDVHICVDDCSTLKNLPWCQELIAQGNTTRTHPLGCGAIHYNSGCEVVGINNQAISPEDCSQYTDPAAQ